MGRNSNSPFKFVNMNQRSNSHNNNSRMSKLASAGASSMSVPPTLDGLHRLLTQLDGKLDSKLEALQRGQDSISTQISVIKAAQEVISEDVRVTKEKLGIHEEILSSHEQEVQDLRARLAKSEQYSRRQHLEILNVTYAEDEDLRELFINIAKKLEVNVQRADIAAIHRLKQPKQNKGKDAKRPVDMKFAQAPPIIVELVNRHLRDEIYRKRYGAEIKNSDLFPDRSFDVLSNEDNTNVQIDKKIYIFQSLSPYYKSLRYKLNTFKKEQNFHKLSFVNNRFLLQKNKDGEVIVITNEYDLEKLRETVVQSIEKSS